MYLSKHSVLYCDKLIINNFNFNTFYQNFFFCKDPTFAAKLLEHAKQINDFAVMYKGKYSDSVPEASEFYR